MQLLILGGTQFLGRALAGVGVARRYEITCLARGSQATPPEGVTFVPADRDAPDCWAALPDQVWDAVIDVSRQPGQVRSALSGVRARHWVFVSTLNVYAGVEAGRREDAELLPALEADTATPEQYGPGKVACESAVRDAVGTGRVPTATIARLGLIGGPGDHTGRSGYWPWRFAHPSGPDVIVPDDADFPVSLIDVRDAAGWLLDAAEQRLGGAVNVAGPVAPLVSVLRDAAMASGSLVRQRRVPPQRLAELGVQPWMGECSLPLWIDDPAMRGFGVVDTTRARAAGLQTRPLLETLADALAYEDFRGGPVGAGLSDADERRIRAAVSASAS